MDEIIRGIALLLLVFLGESFIFTIAFPSFPTIPGDFRVYKFNLDIYVPFISAITISVLLEIGYNIVV